MIRSTAPHASRLNPQAFSPDLRKRYRAQALTDAILAKAGPVILGIGFICYLAALILTLTKVAAP